MPDNHLRDSIIARHLAIGWIEMLATLLPQHPHPPTEDDIAGWIYEHGLHNPGLSQHLMRRAAEFLGTDEQHGFKRLIAKLGEADA